MIATQLEIEGFPATQRDTAPEPFLQRFLRLSQQKGPLVPQACLPEVLGLSTARVYQLVNEGRFEVVELGDRVFVPASELESFKATIRPNGRPKKAA